MASNTAQPRAYVANARLPGENAVVSLCWEILMHDVQLGDTTCTDQDEVEERDVVHQELCPFRSNVSWTSVDETLNVGPVVLARLQVYQGMETFLLWEKKSFPFSCPSCPCHETFQV